MLPMKEDRLKGTFSTSILVLALSVWACGDLSYAASVSLTWDANNEHDLAGYTVYQRMLPSTDYGSPVFSGMPTNSSAPQTTITNLTEGESYGFITTAFDSAGNESSPSTETHTPQGYDPEKGPLPPGCWP